MPIGDGRILKGAGEFIGATGHPIIGALVKRAAEAAAIQAGAPADIARSIGANIVIAPPADVRIQAAEVQNAVDSMPGSKSAMASLTLRALAALGLEEVVRLLNLAAGGIQPDEYVSATLALASIAAILVAGYGRIKAKQSIGKK